MDETSPPKAFPQKLEVIAILQLVVGILEIAAGLAAAAKFLFLGVFTLGLSLLLMPLAFVWLAAGVLSVLSGAKGLGKGTRYGLCLATAIIQTAAIFCCDPLSFAAGLTVLILLTAGEVKAYFASR